MRFDSVVPLAMKGIADDVKGLEFGVSDAEACRIRLAILDGNHVQSFLGGGMRDQLNDGFQRRERLGAPGDGNERKKAMFDLVPTARWQADNAPR